jgi:hypothetical protein
MIDKYYLVKNIFIFIYFLFIPSLIRCQCLSNWFGRNCSEPNMCNYNETSLCPDGFICKITDENQECKFSLSIKIFFSHYEKQPQV